MIFNNKILFLLILSFLIITPLIFYLFQINSENIQYVIKYDLIIKNFISKNYIFFIFIYSVIVFISVLLNLPGGSIRAILAGYFLGSSIGIAIMVIFTTLPCFIHFVFYQDKIFKNYNFEIFDSNKIFSKIKNEFLLLITIRLIPVLPFFLQNIIIAKFRISKTRYLLTTIIGIFPIFMLYVLFGSKINILALENIKPTTVLLEDEYLLYVIIILVIYLIVTNILAFTSSDKKNT